MQKVFQAFDSKANAYLQPFYSATAGTAMRAFIDAAQNEEHQFHKYAADFTLFETGTWDEFTGQHTNLKAHLNLGTALQLAGLPLTGGEAAVEHNENAEIRLPYEITKTGGRN